jgi:hypothetical protein
MAWSEFLEWLAFLEIETAEHTKLDMYLAQIAMEVHRANQDIAAADRERLTFRDKLLRFEIPETPQEKMRRSKRTWAALLGIELPE